MKLAWGAKVSLEFARKAIRTANEIGAKPNDFMSCMAFESGESFSASKRNALTGVAVGLIQFMPKTAKGLGTTSDELGKMTAVEQLDYVADYFKPYHGKLRSIDDLYMAILWPKAVGKPSTYVLFDKDSDTTRTAYFQNKGLDANKDGKVTKAEAAAKVRAKLARGLTPQFARDISLADEPAADPVELPIPDHEAGDEPEQPGPVPLPRPRGVTGDPVTWHVQNHLTRMNYYTSRLDGSYGGKLNGAIAGFILDWDERFGDIIPPKSSDEYEAVKDEILREVQTADAEGFKRPVTQARADADPAIVKEVAPETVTQKRGVIATAWTAFLAFFAGLWDTFSGYVVKAWTWFSGNRDTIPDSAVETGTSFLSNIPPGVWLFIVASLLGFVAVGLIHALKRTVADVQTGRR